MTTDRRGRPLAAYPDRAAGGRLVGLTVFGTAAYAGDGEVRVALLGGDGRLSVPPRDARIADRFPHGEVGLSLGEYVLYVADEYGPWRALTPAAREAVAEHTDPGEVLAAADPDRGAVAGLVTGLSAADSWERRVELAGELRQALLDAPLAGAPGLGTLLDLLDDVTGERERIPAEAADPVGEQPVDERERSFPRIAARRDIAQGVARVLRELLAAPEEALEESTVRRVAFLAGDRPIHDPETAYKLYLVDALEAVGRARPAVLRAALLSLFDGSARERRRGANAAYQLAGRRPADDDEDGEATEGSTSGGARDGDGEDERLFDEPLRAAVREMTGDPDPTVAEAATELELMVEFTD
jgi:hypothetical protein